MTTVPAPSKSQLAYRHIKERIVRHDYTPGFRLVLNTIANDLGMSVVPVREAIRQLEAERLVTFERNVGAHVSMFDDTGYRHSMVTLGILEGAATALAAHRLDSGDISAAREVNQQMARILDHFDPHAFTALNKQFHTILFNKCDNPHLRELVDAEWARLGHLRDSTFSFVPGRAPESVHEHEQILELIENGAGLDEIERTARGHRSATLEAFLAQERPRTTDDPDASEPLSGSESEPLTTPTPPMS